jgi:putative transposase
MKTVCFKIYPNQEQVKTIEKWLGGLRWVWNESLNLVEESDQYSLREKNDLLDDDIPVKWRWHPNKTGDKAKTVFGLCCDITAPYSRRYNKKDQLFPSPYADYRPACSIKRLKGNEPPAAYCKGRDPCITLNKYFSHKKHQDKLWFQAIPSCFIRGTIKSLAEAWKGYKQGIKQRPKYKGRLDRIKSLINNDASSTKVLGRKINITKLGKFNVKTLDERWDASIKVNTLKVCKKASGYYLQLTGDVPKTIYKPSNIACGLDVGLQFIVSDDAGKTVAPPKYYRKAEKRLKRLHRKVSRKQDFKKRHPDQSQGKNLEKAKKLLARQHEKIADQRSRFNHKISTYQVRTCGAIAVENIQLKNLVRRPKPVETSEGSGIYLKNNASAKSGLNKSFSDAGLGQLLSFIETKAKTHEREFVKVNPRYTSQDCPVCKNRVKKSLSNRTHNCLECGTILPRDVAAAINIKNAANFDSLKYRSSVRELTLGEISKEVEEPRMVEDSVKLGSSIPTSSRLEDTLLIPIQLSLFSLDPFCNSDFGSSNLSQSSLNSSKVSQPRKRELKPKCNKDSGIQGDLLLWDVG